FQKHRKTQKPCNASKRTEAIVSSARDADKPAHATACPCEPALGASQGLFQVIQLEKLPRQRKKLRRWGARRHGTEVPMEGRKAGFRSVRTAGGCFTDPCVDQMPDVTGASRILAN